MSVMKWEKAAEEQLLQAPSAIRPMVRKKIEERASSKGAQTVTLADLREAKEQFQSVMSGKHESELKNMVPQENQPGVKMVIVETCHNELSNCANPLIETSEWEKAIEDWARENDISEKLRGMVAGDKVRYHNKLRISISGCPNGCSRPQIADVGIVGFACPEFDPAECNSCGSCAEICPDDAIICDGGPAWYDPAKCQGCKQCCRICPKQCISLSEPAIRIMVGGKLGRHPRLAEVIGEATESAEAVAFIDRIVNDYINYAESGERFADYWPRGGKEQRK